MTDRRLSRQTGYPTILKVVALLAGLLAALLGILAVAGCTPYMHPVTAEVLTELEPAQAQQLCVWSMLHEDLFWEFHSLGSCPYLTYTPTWLAYQASGDTHWWARRLWQFYGEKHAFEGRCGCDSLIAGGCDANGCPVTQTRKDN